MILCFGCWIVPEPILGIPRHYPTRLNNPQSVFIHKNDPAAFSGKYFVQVNAIVLSHTPRLAHSGG